MPLPTLTPAALRQWLNDGAEIALLDVREAGQFGEGHPFFAIPAPYSRLELDVPRLVPRRGTRTVLLDDGDGVAARAAARLQALGYTHLHLLDGGAPAWAAAGHTLFQGVNLPSKTFGELVEQAYGTPHISAHELRQRQARGEPLVLLDGRTFAEHRKMAIPGAISLPNGELALRWSALAPDPQTPIVIHCAGRTRSIIGAQILRSLGIPNPVLALENGTQGWALAGLQLEHGSTRRHQGPDAASDQDRERAARFARDSGAPALEPAQAQAWIDDGARTTYVLDIRSAEEFVAGTLAGALHAPGGQLLQATDQTVGVRRARILVLDAEAVRAPVVAGWLRLLGHEAATVTGGIHAALRLPDAASALPLAPPGQIPPQALADWVATHRPAIVDLRPSQEFRQRHAAGARWSLRPHLAGDLADLEPAQTLLLVAPDVETAALAASELPGHTALFWTRGQDWSAAGLAEEGSPQSPSDARSIDYLFFVHDRHEGNLDAARRYLAWETGLIAQCAPDELAAFRLPAGAPPLAPAPAFAPTAGGEGVPRAGAAKQSA
ncbi:MAG: sulfurtransferase [Burkholderiaceae bacterium]|jgi:rhodanese-related sulfurtransferase|nr:sulfurtransferase [Burkholderiaceae bacterium]